MRTRTRGRECRRGTRGLRRHEDGSPQHSDRDRCDRQEQQHDQNRGRDFRASFTRLGVRWNPPIRDTTVSSSVRHGAMTRRPMPSPGSTALRNSRMVLVQPHHLSPLR